MMIPNQSTEMRTKVVLFLAQGFGSGRAPLAPGTFGTLPGVVLALALLPTPLPVYIGITVLLLAVGIPLCGEAAIALGRKDPPSVVWDEIVGMLVTMTAVPLSLTSILAGFALFRLFDIWKPWPIGWVDRRLQGGLGIMLDDIIAGVMACLLLHAALAIGIPLL
jgi:phosphatidylglycerophosphatase A